MTKLDFNISINNSCTLLIEDVTGYQPDITTGFVQESLTGTGYKLTEGYFKNVVQYHQYKVGPITVNPNEAFKYVDAPFIDYSKNQLYNSYGLTQDGVFTITRIFVVSQATYNRDKNTGAYTGLSVYYTNGINLYKIVDSLPVIVTVDTLLKDTIETNVLIKQEKIIATCFINACYYKMMTLLLELGPACKTVDGALIQSEADLLYMTLESIKYLKDQGSTDEISKMIQTLDACSGPCRKLVTSSNDCGCG